MIGPSDTIARIDAATDRAREILARPVSSPNWGQRRADAVTAAAVILADGVRSPHDHTYSAEAIVENLLAWSD